MQEQEQWGLLKRLSRSLHTLSLVHLADVLLQVLPRIRSWAAAELLGGAFRHQLAALLAALRSQVDDPIRHLDDIQVVLDDDHRVAGIHQ